MYGSGQRKNMKTIGDWFKIIVLPFFLIPLIFMPVDMVTGIFWFIAFVIFIKSSVTLIKFTFQFLRKKTQFQKELIRPFLSITIIIISCTLVMASQRSADEFARRIAYSAQELCQQNNKCPEKINEMKHYNNNVYKTFYGKYGTKYPVTYIVSEDKMSFEIRVRHNIDEFLIIKGGTKNKMKEISQHF